MNKAELASALRFRLEKKYVHSRLSLIDANFILDEVFDIIREQLKQNQKLVSIVEPSRTNSCMSWCPKLVL